MKIDLHYFRHFLAVAEELHFGRAADRLNMEQAPLSQSIQRLEKYLGVTLFERSARGTRLTGAGAALMSEARLSVAQFEKAIAIARAVEKDRQDPVRIGFVTSGILRLLPAAIRIYRERYIGAEVKLLEASTDDLLASIGADRLDLALVHPFSRRPSGVALQEIQRDRTLVALPRSHPLSHKPVVALQELADEPLVFFPRDASPELHKRIMTAFRRLGLKPQIRQEARLTPTILSLVSAGLGYAFVQESAQAMPFSEVVFRSARGLPANLHWSLSLAWKPSTASLAARNFIATLREAVGKLQPN